MDNEFKGRFEALAEEEFGVPPKPKPVPQGRGSVRWNDIEWDAARGMFVATAPDGQKFASPPNITPIMTSADGISWTYVGGGGGGGAAYVGGGGGGGSGGATYFRGRGGAA